MKNAEELSPAVKLMIQSGAVPQNALQQLINWRLLPEGSEESHGEREVTLESEWSTVEEFVGDLGKALSEESASIRETSFDTASSIRKAWLIFEDIQKPSSNENVMLDRLGRVVLPGGDEYADVCEITFSEYEGLHKREVVKKEPRHQGKERVAWVCYLSEEEIDDNDNDQSAS